jgi:hypothetical protein
MRLLGTTARFGSTPSPVYGHPRTAKTLLFRLSGSTVALVSVLSVVWVFSQQGCRIARVLLEAIRKIRAYRVPPLLAELAKPTFQFIPHRGVLPLQCIAEVQDGELSPSHRLDGGLDWYPIQERHLSILLRCGCPTAALADEDTAIIPQVGLDCLPPGIVPSRTSLQQARGPPAGDGESGRRSAGRSHRG